MHQRNVCNDSCASERLLRTYMSDLTGKVLVRR